VRSCDVAIKTPDHMDSLGMTKKHARSNIRVSFVAIDATVTFECVCSEILYMT